MNVWWFITPSSNDCSLSFELNAIITGWEEGLGYDALKREQTKHAVSGKEESALWFQLQIQRNWKILIKTQGKNEIRKETEGESNQQVIQNLSLSLSWAKWSWFNSRKTMKTMKVDLCNGYVLWSEFMTKYQRLVCEEHTQRSSSAFYSFIQYLADAAFFFPFLGQVSLYLSLSLLLRMKGWRERGNLSTKQASCFLTSVNLKAGSKMRQEWKWFAWVNSCFCLLFFIFFPQVCCLQGLFLFVEKREIKWTKKGRGGDAGRFLNQKQEVLTRSKWDRMKEPPSGV